MADVEEDIDITRGNVRVLVEDNRMKCKRCRIFYKSELGPNSGIRTYR